MEKSILSLTDEHIVFTSIQEVRAICQPFLDAFNMAMLNYVRNYDDGSHISLVTNDAVAHYFYQEGYHKTILIGKNDPTFIKDKQSAYFLSNVFPGISHPQTVDLKKYFDYGQSFVFLKREKDYYEYFSVTALQNFQCSTEFYLKNVDALIKFFEYFAEKAEMIINEFDKQRLFLPKNFNIPNSHISHNTKCRRRNIKRNNLEQQSKAWQGKHFPKYSITERESQCLHFLILGKTASEIAVKLGLSKRTVETHIERIKYKFSCTKRSELIERAILTYIPNW